MSAVLQQIPERDVQTPVRRSRLGKTVGQHRSSLAVTQAEVEQEFSYVPAETPKKEVHPEEGAAVIQAWEGTVLEIHGKTLRTRLHAKVGQIDDHVADIDMEWVSPQDLDLVQPGAVFYLTLARKLTRGRSIQNSQELRFRRLPAWSKRDAEKIHQLGADLFAKLSGQATSE